MSLGVCFGWRRVRIVQKGDVVHSRQRASLEICVLCCWCVSVLGRGPSDSISKKHRADYNHTSVASSLSTSTSTSCCSCQPLLGSRRPTDRPTTNNLVRQRLGASSVQDSRSSHVEAPIASEARCTAEPIDAAVKPVRVLPQPQVRHTVAYRR